MQKVQQICGKILNITSHQKNSSKNHNEIWLLSKKKKQEIKNAGEEKENENSFTAGVVVMWYRNHMRQYEGSSKN